MIRNTEERYGLPAQALHWLIAVMIIGLFAMGLWMTGLPRGDFRSGVYGFHKAMGVLVIVFAAARLWWRMRNPLPRDPDGPAWQHKMAHLAHWALYALMFAVPVCGWLMSDTNARPVSMFGLFQFPLLIGKNEALHKVFEKAHEMLAFLTMALVAGHVVAAVWHHRIKKDAVLARMLPFAAK